MYLYLFRGVVIFCLQLVKPVLDILITDHCRDMLGFKRLTLCESITNKSPTAIRSEYA